MTKELLEQYPDICAEIEELERENKTVISDIVRGSSDEFRLPSTRSPCAGLGRRDMPSTLQSSKRKSKR